MKTSHQAIVRARHVRAARQGGETVLLDVGRGQYHTLNEVGTRVWDLLASPTTVPAIAEQICLDYAVELNERARVIDDVAQLVQQLRRNGLLESSRRAPVSRGDPPMAYAGRRQVRWRLLLVPSAWEALLRILLVRWALKLAGYGWTTRWIMDHAERWPVSDSGYDDATVATVEYRIAMGAAFFPGRAACLERSLVLYGYLRSRGVPVEYCVGARLYPFAAHAWVEYRGVPINDVPEHVRQFYAVGVSGS